ncbi:MAG: type II 3-dehydroquinate dehydratase [Bacilli bacterium]|jgi:3-dehydroquinate dehydratase-2|nr:type II 3-dehydroquinate dehydratase [Acholeplasmataceae bacterium]
MNILIINGPNLNFLGIREPEIYGYQTYADLIKYLKKLSRNYKIKVKTYQSNHEGDIIDYIQNKYQKFDAIIINPGALTHYSYALLDCIKSISVPTIEVHLSDLSKRESFRQNSVIAEACVASIMGKHFESYHDAIKFIVRGLKHE